MTTSHNLLAIIILPFCSFAQNVGIGTATPAYKLHVVASATVNSSAVIFGFNSGTTGNAVLGVSNNPGTNALQGTSNKGIGVLGYSDSYMAVAGTAISGTALYGSSVSGYSLDVSGKVKISGGNTNPRNGTVLTSDASGNAVWKTPKVAFSAKGIASGYTTIPKQTSFKIQYATEEYDYGNNFKKVGDDPSPFNTSEFTAPVAGLYEFSATINWTNYSGGSANDDTRYGDLSLSVTRNGVATELGEVGESMGGFDHLRLLGNSWTITKQVKLQAGDKVNSQIWLRNDDSDETLYFDVNNINSCWFYGRLIWED